MPIYFRARTDDGDDWYEIKSDDSTTVDDQQNQIMSPIFPRPNHLAQSSAVAVGSRIYVMGGCDVSVEYTAIPETFKDVYYLDTLCPENGWHKTFSMMKPREAPYSIASNGKIYVMGSSAMVEEDPYPWAEVLDTDLGGGWTPLLEDKPMDLFVTGHAVLEGGNRILVHSVFDPCLHYYDVQDKCWGIYSRDFGVNKSSSAFLDGVLYYVDWTTPGVIYALLVSNGETVPKQVKGLEDLPFDRYKNMAIMRSFDCGDGDRYSDDLDFEWVPAERPEGPSPSVNLVSHGRDELAVIWTGLDFWNVAGAVLHVYFSKLKISKVENAAGVVDELVAHPLAHKHYRVRASMFVGCLSTCPFGEDDITTTSKSKKLKI
ncbi:hypothetical protein ACSBR2_013791 [Camellia fascicularis]